MSEYPLSWPYEAKQLLAALERKLEEAELKARTYEHGIKSQHQQITQLQQQLAEARQDAERFVFEHTHPDEMVLIEMEALSGASKPLGWWRDRIDAALEASK